MVVNIPRMLIALKAISDHCGGVEIDEAKLTVLRQESAFFLLRVQDGRRFAVRVNSDGTGEFYLSGLAKRTGDFEWTEDGSVQITNAHLERVGG